ncbi:TIGR03086 family metal-binding protein [Actinomycetospora straminea]|uniref:TIGR03086 family protein n=1 Tax=Actinomycetospora straminea TaxID=663607 RepID=A0ABP9EFD5_9PSEU|nr:TIGR03086 family metal-binding protein [Actinomycetospora straminea]MDD7934459.1 TIGR03086 family metal-binding protein [Actinomycetospora straminea]
MSTTNPDTATVTHRGHALHVEQEPGSGPTIVLLHGFPDDRLLHDRLLPYLAGRHVVRFDFLGWGASDKPPGHPRSAHDQTAELAAVVDAVADGPVVLVAHDASGPPAIDFALLAPHRVAGLVLLNTYYGWTPTMRAPEAITLFSTPGLRALARAVARRAPRLDRWLFHWQVGRFITDDTARAELVPRLYADFVPAREAFWRLNADLPRTLLDRRRRARDLARLGVPVRVVFGADDPYLNPRVARALAGWFADAELTLVPHAGHYVQVDAPAAVAERVLTMPSAPDLLDLDRRALAATAAVAEAIPRRRWTAPTPCAGWSVRDVVDHLVENDRAQLAVLGGPDAGRDLRRSGEAVLAAHARPAATDARFDLGGQQRSARASLAVHFADVLVHGWDLARAAGLPYRLDEDLATAAERVVSAFPDLAWGPGAAFAARLDAGPGASAGDRLLALTGRDPGWRPPVTT